MKVIVVAHNCPAKAVVEAFAYHDYAPKSRSGNEMVFAFDDFEDTAKFMFAAGRVAYYLGAQYNRADIECLLT